MTAKLFIIGTPIGNLGDLSPRAQETLGTLDALVCEDTRRTGQLLKHFGVSIDRLIVSNDHNEATAAATVVELLNAGNRVGLVSDAGMPVISDPGFRVIAAAIRAGFDPEVVPGPTAITSALVLSGIEAHRYVFEGFLPRKGSARTERLSLLSTEQRAIVIYESPQRVERTIEDLAEHLGGDRQVAIARELTKLYEEVWRGTLGGASEYVANGMRGEIVLVIAGAPRAGEPTEGELVEALQRALDDGATKRDAVGAVASSFGASKRLVYDLVHQLDP